MDLVSLCNAALGLVGAQPITALTDDVTTATLCSRLLPMCRDAVLEEREWTFAVSRQVLAADTTAPAFGYDYRYLVPSTVLRVLQLEDGTTSTDVQWVREGAYLLTDQAAPVYVRWLTRVEDPALWSAGFTQTLIYRLAAALAVPVTENRTLQADLYQLYQRALRDAAATDGMQGRSQVIRAGGIAAARR